VCITGIGDLWAGDYKPGKAFKEFVPVAKVLSSISLKAAGTGNSFSGIHDVESVGDCCSRGVHIVLLHNPDGKDRILNRKWELVLCGHTHGGQMNLPLVGQLYLPVRDRKHVAGLYTMKGKKVFISVGVGCTVWFRLNCPPEVVLIELSP
jgi:predicted MPP superfamily phosphohydrolase